MKGLIFHYSKNLSFIIQKTLKHRVWVLSEHFLDEWKNSIDAENV